MPRDSLRVPIIVLSVKGEETIKIEALEAGADDYFTKPFNVDGLLARVRAALRRATVPLEPETAVIDTRDFCIDIPARKVEVKAKDIHLTPKEFDLLVYLARNPGKVVTHHALLTAIWGPNSAQPPEYLRVFVGHLRKKLEPGRNRPTFHRDRALGGYRFEPDD